MNPVPVSPVEPLWKEMPVTRGSINFRVPNIGTPPPGSLHRVPIEKDAPFMEPSNYLSEFLVNGPSMILNRAPMEKVAHLHSLLKSHSKQASC
jgi:hypothetical protein